MSADKRDRDKLVGDSGTLLLDDEGLPRKDSNAPADGQKRASDPASSGAGGAPGAKDAREQGAGQRLLNLDEIDDQEIEELFKIESGDSAPPERASAARPIDLAAILGGGQAGGKARPDLGGGPAAAATAAGRSQETGRGERRILTRSILDRYPARPEPASRARG